MAERSKELKAGTLTISSAVGQQGPCEKINYDPVLLFRSPSYAASFDRRTQGR
jgi:hypothetical protein